MNILIVVSDLGTGGGQRSAVTLANILSEEHQVYLFDVHPQYRNSGIYKQLEEKVHLLEYRPGFLKLLNVSIKNSLFFRFGKEENYKKKWTEKSRKIFLKKWIKQTKVQIINSHICWADFFVSDIIDDTVAKWVVSMHGCYDRAYPHNDPGDEFMMKAAKVFGKADAMVYLTEKNLDVFNHIPRNSSMIKRKIYNGYAPLSKSGSLSREGLGIAKDAFVFGIVSRAEKVKGWDEAIKAVAMARERSARDVHIVLAGDGRDLKEFKEKYQQPFVHFTGHMDNVNDIIALTDVGVLPSITECLPYSVIEFMAMGKPVIASQSGEIPFMIREGEYLAGQLLDISSGSVSVDELAARMLAYLEDRKMYAAHSTATGQMIGKFSMDKFKKNYTDLFKEIAG